MVSTGSIIVIIKTAIINSEAGARRFIWRVPLAPPERAKTVRSPPGPLEQQNRVRSPVKTCGAGLVVGIQIPIPNTLTKIKTKSVAYSSQGCLY